MLIAVVSVWKDVYKNQPPTTFFMRFTRIGIVLIVTSFIFIVCNYLKDSHTEYKVSIAEKAKIKANSISDASQKKLVTSQQKLEGSQNSLYQLQVSVREAILKGVDSSYRKSIKASNEALAKYHIKIIDSLHTVVGTLKLNSVNPQLSLAPISNHPPAFLDSVGSDILNFQFVSVNATSYHIHVNVYYILQTNGSIVFLGKDVLSLGEGFINMDVVRTISGPVSKIILSLPQIFVIVEGSFSKDPYGKEIIPYLEAFNFNFRDNKFIGKSDITLSLFHALIGGNK